MQVFEQTTKKLPAGNVLGAGFMVITSMRLVSGSGFQLSPPPPFLIYYTDSCEDLSIPAAEATIQVFNNTSTPITSLVRRPHTARKAPRAPGRTIWSFAFPRAAAAPYYAYSMSHISMFPSKTLWACPRGESPDLRREEVTTQHRLTREGSWCHPTSCTSRTPGATPPNLLWAMAASEVPPAAQMPGCHGRVLPTPLFQATPRETSPSVPMCRPLPSLLLLHLRPRE